MFYLNPYINFGTRCAEAMTFYQSCLGGELDMHKVGDTPMADQLPPETHDSIMHAALTVQDIVVLMGSDLREGAGNIQETNTIALSLNCTSEDQIEDLFQKIGEGGTITHPLKTEFWGATYGDLTDKFGIRWMFNHQKAENLEESTVTE